MTTREAKHAVRLQEWGKMVQCCQESSLTVNEWCNQNGIKPACYYFCGRKSDRIKALLWDGSGYVLLYKRLAGQQFQWPRSEKELIAITPQQFRWLMEGLSITQ